ncbi:MAG: histidine triad nucleotide-binding protein [Alphaproteobacteria bacterium]
MAYDPNNIFAKILRGEIPCKKLFENEHVLAFHDIHPQAPVHVLVIPKGPYKDMNDFCVNAGAAEQAALMTGLRTAAEKSGVLETGYRVIANTGADSRQDVPHLHFHVIGGRRLRGGLVAPPE